MGSGLSGVMKECGLKVLVKLGSLEVIFKWSGVGIWHWYLISFKSPSAVLMWLTLRIPNLVFCLESIRLKHTAPIGFSDLLGG